MTFELAVGAAHVTRVTELAAWPFPVGDLFPGATLDASAAAGVGPRDVDPATGDLVMSIHVYIIQIGDRVVVVDTGNGNAKHRPTLLPHHMFDTDFLDRFAATGTGLSDVDVVVNTHLHPDHCGWNTRLDGGVWRPTFPSATYLFSVPELEGLQALAATEGLTGVEADLARTYEDSVRPVIDSGRWAGVEDGQVIASHDGTDVVVRLAAGHTLGHVIVEIRSADGGAVLSGDVIHHPVQVEHRELCQGGDADPDLARRTREALLRRCAEEDLLLLPAHFTADAPLRASIDGSGHPELTPVTWKDVLA